jgi:hypothetical protein
VSFSHGLIDGITTAAGELRNALKEIRQSASGAANTAALDMQRLSARALMVMMMPTE